MSAARVPTAIAVAVAQAFTVLSAMAEEPAGTAALPAKGEAIQRVIVEGQRSTDAMARAAQRGSRACPASAQASVRA